MMSISMIFRYASSSVDVSLAEMLKGKAIPLQAWRDPEGSRRLRLPVFKTIGT
jgi:hypothetical protein